MKFEVELEGLEELNKEQKMNEALIVLAEECGEVVQECCKILRFGFERTNQKALEMEIGDVMCLFEYLSDNGYIDWGNVSQRVFEKREKLHKYSSLYE